MAERTWDKFEAALLIDTYNSVDVGAFKRNIAVSKLSNNLRKRAVNLGLSIDSKYRNANGISMMLSTLVYLFSDGTKQPFKMPNNMFQEVYKIYRDNPKEFATLLAEAKKQCSDEFDLSTLSMENYISLIQKKTITGLNFEIVNKIELLKVRFIEHCNQAKRKGSLVWVENSDLIVWLKMLDSRLINISIINDSIFDSKDFYKFFRCQKSNELEDVLRTLVGKYNYTKFAEYLNFYIEYVNSLSDQDKVYLGFTSVFEENVVEREKLDKITAHSEITKENIDYEAKSGSGLFSNNNEIVSAGKDKPVLEATQNGVTRTAISDGSEEKHEQVGQKDETIVANHENESEYDDASDINEERFANWLAKNAPSNNLGELYTYYSDVTDFCIRLNVLKRPLLKTVQLSVVKKVQKVVNENRLFKVTHRKSLRKIIAAVQYYVNYIKMLNADPKTTGLANSTIEKVVPPLEETASEVVKEIEEVQVVNEPKQGETVDVTEGMNTVHEIEEVDSTQKAYYTVDFNDISDLTYSFPVELKYFKKTIQIEQKWRSVYINIVKALYEQYPKAIPIGKSFTGKGRIDFGNSPYARFMIAPKEVVNDMYLETNLSAKDIVGKIKALLDLCHIFYDDIIIKYGYKDDHHLPEEKKETDTLKTKATIVQGSIFEEKEIIGAGVKLDNNANDGDIHDLLLETIIKDNVEYADKRSKGGCLWVALSSSDEEYIEKLRDFGAEFKFAKCSSALGYRDGWWTQDIINNINEEPINKPDPVPVNPPRKAYENFIHMLKKYYSKGFRVGSGLEIKKFKSQWESEFKKDAPDDGIINKSINDLTITIGKKAYLPDILLPAEIKERIFFYIKESFANGNHIIYYEALYEHFSQDLLNSNINNSDMLEIYLKRTNYENHFYLREKYFTDSISREDGPTEVVRKYLKEAGCPVNITKIYNDISQISNGEIYKILTGIGSSEFVNNQKGEFFHVSIVDLNKKEIANIKEIIDSNINNNWFISGVDLWHQLNKKYPDIVAQYPFLTDLGMRSVLAYLLGDIYDFKGTIISKKGENLRSADVYQSFARNNKEFTIDDLLALSEELNTGIYYDEVYKYAVRINANKFISKDSISFDVSAIDNILDDLCKSDYASLDASAIFSGFPYCGYTWNIWLLESFVANYSNRFTLLHANFNTTKCVGAIVKVHSDINTFDELLARALADSQVSLSKDLTDNIRDSLEFFVENGYLARKSYSTIEAIVEKAINLR